MIDPALQMSHAAVWIFWVKKILFIYLTPVILGFLVATLFPIGARFAAQHRPFVVVMLGSAIAPAVMLLGWSFVARELITAPLYGLGYGIGVALLSRVHAIRFRPRFRIETRRAAHARAAAEASVRAATTVRT